MLNAIARVTVACAALFLLGCDGGGSGGSGGSGGGAAAMPKADTPQKLVDNLVKVMTSGDKEGAKKLIDPASPNSEQAGEFIGLMAEMVHAMEKMSKAAEAKFGAEAKEALGDGEQAMDNPFSKLKDGAAKAQITIEGDTATATIPDGDEPMKMVKRDGAWYLDAAEFNEMMEEGPGTELAKKMIAGFVSLAKRGETMVAESATLDEFKTKMEAASQEIMAPLMAEMFKAAFEQGLQNNQPNQPVQPNPDE